MLKDRVNPVEVPRILHRLKSRVVLGFKDNQAQDAVVQRDDFFSSSHCREWEFGSLKSL
jgi:hypothetical protein